MTLFAIYRVLEFPGKVNLNSIVDFPKVDVSYYLPAYSQYICSVFRPMFLKRFKDFGIWEIGFRGNPLKAMKMLRCKPFVISSSTPTVSKVDKSNVSILSTSPAGILLSVIV